MKRTRKYWNELAGYLSGEMSDYQKKAFLLKAENDRHIITDIELMKQTWNDFNSNPKDKYMQTGKAWDSLHMKLEKDGLLDTPGIPVRKFDLNYALRVAAVILIVLAVGVPAVYYSVNSTANRKGIIEYNAAEGIRTIDMPDGSRVFLNEGATLEFNKDFDLRRDVKLDGEGYFDVMSDPQRPFRVNTGKVVVTVLGTSFNVKNAENNEVEVYVESGKVRVDYADKQQSVTLLPGQIGKVNGSLQTSDRVDANYLSWKTKDFKFVNEPVDHILEVLEKSYHVQVNTGNIPVSGMRLTTTYSDQSFEAILNTICTALNITYEKDGKAFVLKSN